MDRKAIIVLNVIIIILIQRIEYKEKIKRFSMMNIYYLLCVSDLFCNQNNKY